ncbi:hypothetical protein C8T65DRAFT_631606 [Cerioporus squamosus]|nr:hypothetical protein C8T65DRAFT_631606 [Cerioporus squamosus]
MQYHKAKVHQQVTTVLFKNYPGVHFTIKRNPETKCFHCPYCVKRYPLASPLRDHMVLKCDGYAQYRVSSLPKLKIRPPRKNDRSDSGKPVEDAMPVDEVVVVKDEQKDEVIVTGTDANTTQESEATGTLQGSFALQSLLYPESQADDPHAIAESEFMEVAPEPTNATVEVASPTISDQSSSVEDVAEVVFLPPVLRPATWSPISVANRIPDWRLISYSPSLVTSGSSCSTTSLRSVSDDPSGSRFTLPVKTEFHYKLEPTFEDDLQHVPRQLDHSLSAAQVFLDGLWRPLGHAAPHLHGLGVVTEADLDLVCAMPDAWDEVGDLLRGSGVTMIEWLMVKEAFKTRAKRLPERT